MSSRIYGISSYGEGCQGIIRSEIDYRGCAIWTEATENLKTLPLGFIIGNEKALNLVDQITVQITEEANVRMVPRISGHGD